MPRKLTTKQFIKKAKKVHGDRYDYSKVNYINAHKKITIICRKHGEFQQIPHNHINNKGCSACKGGISSSKEEFLTKAKKVHGDRYDYSKFIYVNAHTKGIINCKEHGEFFQEPNNHLQKQGCKKCSIKVVNKFNTSCTKNFIKKAKKIHGDRYDYSKTIYFNVRQSVVIICKNHGEFRQKPFNHLQNRGCPKCNSSKGELQIEKYLNKNNIKYETQKRFKNCKYKRSLPFDFYLTDYNTCIEYDGMQHFKPIKFYGGKEKFNNLQKTDKIKNNFCKKYNIKLIRISYKDNFLEKLNENHSEK